MSVLVKDMEMPKNCDDCFLGDYYCEKCEHEDGYHMAGGRPYHCPLVEVVRCKDCYYWTKVDDEPKGVCVCRTNLQAALMDLAPQTEENDYCSWGECEEVQG